MLNSARLKHGCFVDGLVRVDFVTDVLCAFCGQNLMIQEKSPGVDGQQYSLRFTVEIPDMDVPSYDLPFLFYDGLL